MGWDELQPIACPGGDTEGQASPPPAEAIKPMLTVSPLCQLFGGELLWGVVLTYFFLSIVSDNGIKPVDNILLA